jgi:hypothetical protein
MAMVLYTGWDQSLMDTRTLILRSAGHEVHQARTQNEVASVCQEHQVDVVVICQTVSNPMKRLIATLIDEHCPNVKVLELYHPHRGKAIDEADSWFAVPAEEPGDLAEQVTRLASTQTP